MATMIPKECKRLAEVDFPIAEVGKHAVSEKELHRLAIIECMAFLQPRQDMLLLARSVLETDFRPQIQVIDDLVRLCHSSVDFAFITLGSGFLPCAGGPAKGIFLVHNGSLHIFLILFLLLFLFLFLFIPARFGSR